MHFFRTIYTYKKTLAKITLVFLFIPMLFLSFPQKSEAFWPTVDVVGTPSQIIGAISGGTTAVGVTTQTIFASMDNFTKYVIKPLVIAMARSMIRQFTAQTVKWINSGFKGNPAFVTDPGQFFQNAGDKIAADALSSNSFITNSLCTPFKAQVRLALVNNYLSQTSDGINKCTVDTVVKNYSTIGSDFYAGGSQGGWNGWFSVSQNPQNNPYGAYIQGRDSLQARLAAQNTKINNQLNQGKGFLSFERCKPGSPIVKGSIATNEASPDEDGVELGAPIAPTMECPAGQADLGTNCAINNAKPPGSPANWTPPPCVNRPAPANGCKVPLVATYKDSKGTSVTQAQVDAGIGEGDCTQKETVTPGSVIAGQLEGTLGSSVRQLELAQSVDQIVGALLMQLLNQIVGGSGTGGLLGTSRPNSTDNSRSILQQISAGSPESKAEDAQFVTDIKNNQTTLLNQAQAGVSDLTNKLAEPTLTFSLDPADINPTISAGTPFDPLKPGIIIATDLDGTDLSSQVKVTSNPDPFDSNVHGTYILTYTVTNEKGISSAKTLIRTVTVTPAIVPLPPTPAP